MATHSSDLSARQKRPSPNMARGGAQVPPRHEHGAAHGGARRRGGPEHGGEDVDVPAARNSAATSKRTGRVRSGWLSAPGPIDTTLGVGGSEGADGRGADAVARQALHVRDQPVAERGGSRARLAIRSSVSSVDAFA